MTPALYAPVKPPDRVCQNTSKNPYKIIGALAKAVISTIEAVGTPPNDAIKGASNQLDCCTAPDTG